MGTRTRRIVTTAAIGSLFAVAGVAAAAVDDSSTAVRTTPARVQYGSADAFERRAVTQPRSLDGSPDAIEHRLASDG